MGKTIRLTFFCSILIFGTAAFAGPTQYATAINQFPIGFYVPSASTNSAPFTGSYYVAVVPYADSNDDPLSFTQLAGSVSFFDPTTNSTGTYASSSDANTTLAFGSLPFSTASYGSSNPLPDGSTPSNWGGRDFGIALQFFAPQQDPGCFAYQYGCAANAMAGYMTSSPAVYRPDATNSPDIFDVRAYLPDGYLTLGFDLIGVDPNSVGYAFTNDRTVNNNSVIILVGSIASNASQVQVVWTSSQFQSTVTTGGGSSSGSGSGSGSGDGGGTMSNPGSQLPGTPVTNPANPPTFIQASQPDSVDVPEPASLLLLGSGLLFASAKKKLASRK